MTGKNIIEAPSWEHFHQSCGFEKQPWYFGMLDADFDRALSAQPALATTVLDIGAGSATQALALLKKGFRVIVTDISITAMRKVRKSAADAGCSLPCVCDDIRKTSISAHFDVLIDRGCLHVMHPEERAGYRESVEKLLRGGGHLLLKCFSRREQGEWGPYRFTPEEIRALFTPIFEIISIHESIYQGYSLGPAMALFCVLKKKRRERH